MELTVESTDVNELLEDLAEILKKMFVKIIEVRIKHCDLTKKIESININELLEDLAEILKERKFVKIIESRIEHCDLTKKYL